MPHHLDVEVSLVVTPEPGLTSGPMASSLATDLTARLYDTVQRFAAERLAGGQAVTSSCDTRGLRGTVRYRNFEGP